LFAVLAAGTNGWRPAAAGATGAAAMAMPAIVVHIAVPRALGFGDVKFATALGLSAGLLDWRVSLLALAIGSGSTLAVAVMGRRGDVAFGPGLVAGSAIAIGVAALGSLAGTSLFGWELAAWR
jgi:leader peptidase (prepilin peptidase)/N-methyltransferase